MEMSLIMMAYLPWQKHWPKIALWRLWASGRVPWQVTPQQTSMHVWLNQHHAFLHELAYALCSDNYIGAVGAALLASALKSNNTLEELSIKGNELGNEGTKVICEALKERSGGKFYSSTFCAFMTNACILFHTAHVFCRSQIHWSWKQ